MRTAAVKELESHGSVQGMITVKSVKLWVVRWRLWNVSYSTDLILHNPEICAMYSTDNG